MRTLLPYTIIFWKTSLTDQETLFQFSKRLGIHPLANFGIGVQVFGRMINAGVNFG